MNARTKRRLTWLGLAAAASAPYSAIIGLHLYAKTQPVTCEDRRDVILSRDKPASFGIVRTCWAWKFWQVSKSLHRDAE